jgi:cytidine deaminase
MATITPETVEELRIAAAAAAENAYAPYSGFRVGAALLFEDGGIATGCNVENVSYGLTICAERTALVRAIAENGSARRIVAVLVTNLNDAPSPPCGACLQALSEFVTANAAVCFNDSRQMVAKPFAELLPYAFGNWDTKSDLRR